MKKVSFLLALSVMLSVMGMLPAEAKPYEAYPFVYEDFEINNLEQQKAEGLISCNTNTTFAWTADGAAESHGAVEVTEKGNFSHMRFPVDHNAMIAGQKIRYSCWIKPVNTEFVNKSVTFFVYGYGKAGTIGWSKNSAVASGVNFKKGEWTHVEVIAPWDGILDNNSQDAMDKNGGRYFDYDPTQPMRIEIRIGSGGVANEFPTVEGETKPAFIQYLLDDVIVEPVNDPNASAETKDTNIFAGGNMNTAEDLAKWT